MNKEVIASGDELLRMGQAGARPLPEKGQKWRHLPDGDAAERRRHVHSRLTRSLQLYSLLSEPTASKPGDLYRGVWRPSSADVLLDRAPGRFFHYMGFQRGRQLFLHWDEALFMCEMGSLVLTDEGQDGELAARWSVQQAYSRLLGACGHRHRCYRLYAHLSRAGYRVVHHHSRAHLQTPPQQRSITEYERRIGLDRYLLQSATVADHEGQSSPSPKQETCDDDLPSPSSKPDGPPRPAPQLPGSDCVQLSGELEVTSRATPLWYPALSAEQAEAVASGSTTASPRAHACEQTGTVDSAEHAITTVTGATAEQQMDHTDRTVADRGQPVIGISTHRAISFGDLVPHLAGSRGVVAVRPAPAALLPPGVRPPAVCHVRLLPDRRRRSPADRYPSCLPPLPAPAANWTQLKQQLRRVRLQGGSGLTGHGGPTLVPRGWQGSTQQLMALLQLSPLRQPTGAVAASLRLTDAPPAPTAEAPRSTNVPSSPKNARSESTAVPPRSTIVPPSSTAVPPSSTAVPPSSTAVPRSSTAVPPSSTAVPPSSTDVPSDATTTRRDPTSTVPGSQQPAVLDQSVVYDVYAPSDAYKKSCPPPPRLRCFVVRPEDPLLVPAAAAAAGAGSPLCAAVVPAAGPPALYTLHTGRLVSDSSLRDDPV